jgi:hypothetical protein
MVIAAILIVGAGEAKIKGLPQIKNQKDYTLNLKGKKVESLKYTVYDAKVEGDTILKGEVADFIAEIFFDDKGNRNKEIVYHIETGEVEVDINWQYNEDAGTVIESRFDKKGDMTSRYEYVVNYTLNTVVARKYENLRYGIPPTLRENILMYEEIWTEEAKKKRLKRKKTTYSIADGQAMRQLISEEILEKPYSALWIIESLSAPIDYTWLYDYSDKTFRAANRKTRKEEGFNGGWYEYKAKKGLVNKMLQYEKGKILRNESKFEYSFDDQNNWTQVIQIDNNKPKYVVQRDIKYKQ